MGFDLASVFSALSDLDWVRAFSAGRAMGMGQQRAAVATGSSPAAFSTGWNLGEVMAVELGLAEEA